MKTKNITRAGYLQWDDGDTLCISVVFTWDLPLAKKYADSMRHRKVRMGGPAVDLALKTMPGFFLGCSAELGGSIPGVLQKFNPLATRTSFGCPRKCKFCSVPIVAAQQALDEFGKRIIAYDDWPDLPVIFDDNLLANPISHFDKVCDRLEKHDFCDFNQGTDARFLNDHHAERFARLNKPTIRMALDSMGYVDAWDRALDRLRKAGVAKRNIRTYAIMAFGTSPDECWEICAHIEKQGVKPLPMWFHELDAMKRNIVTDRQAELGWNDYERRKLMQWFYQHKRATES